MADSDKAEDSGVITALLERMRTQRLPRVLDIKAKVDAGGTLDDYEIAFLGEVFGDANSMQPLWNRHPELNQIAGTLIHLYHDITKRALENESGHPIGGDAA